MGNGAECGSPVAEFALQWFGSGGSKEANLDVRPFSICTSHMSPGWTHIGWPGDFGDC